MIAPPADLRGDNCSILDSLENGEQSITLTRPHGVLKRLKVNIRDVF